MNIGITYEEALKRYPSHVQEIEKALRAGKSKARNDDLDTFSWFFDWGQTVRSYSFNELLDGTTQKDSQQFDSLTVEEQVADTLIRCSIVLGAQKGRAFVRSKSPITDNPPEIANFYRKIYTEQEQQRKQYEALPQHEKDRQFQDALQKAGFFKGGGIVMGL